MEKTKELQQWESAKKMMTVDSGVTLGPYFSHIVRKSPRRLLHLLSYYKFAAKMIGPQKSILEVGCSEGFGTGILAEFATRLLAVDIDQDAIKIAQDSFTKPNVTFECRDFLKTNLGAFDSAACFDVIEHIFPENENLFLKGLADHLTPEGMAVVGTPSLNSDQYANPHTREGHVNLYSGERLQASMERFFKKVIVFSANDELVHTGYWPMAHYFLAVGFFKK